MYLLGRDHWADTKISHNWCKEEPTTSSIKALGLQVRGGSSSEDKHNYLGRKRGWGVGRATCSPRGLEGGRHITPICPTQGLPKIRFFSAKARKAWANPEGLVPTPLWQEALCLSLTRTRTRTVSGPHVYSQTHSCRWEQLPQPLTLGFWQVTVLLFVKHSRNQRMREARRTAEDVGMLSWGAPAVVADLTFLSLKLQEKEAVSASCPSRVPGILRTGHLLQIGLVSHAGCLLGMDEAATAGIPTLPAACRAGASLLSLASLSCLHQPWRFLVIGRFLRMLVNRENKGCGTPDSVRQLSWWPFA